MGIFLPPDCRSWRYKFRWQGQWRRGNTGCSRKEDAERWLRKFRVALEQRAGGLAMGAKDSPRFTDWAAVYFTYASPRLTRPDAVDVLLRVVLWFWGDAPPGVASTPAAPYHGLRLLDPIEDSDWLLLFEEWMTATRETEAVARGYEFVATGHGPVGTWEDVRAWREYLEKLRDQVAAGIAAGQTLEEMQQSIPMEEYSHWEGFDWVDENVLGMYHFLTD